MTEIPKGTFSLTLGRKKTLGSGIADLTPRFLRRLLPGSWTNPGPAKLTAPINFDASAEEIEAKMAEAGMPCSVQKHENGKFSIAFTGANRAH